MAQEARPVREEEAPPLVKPWPLLAGGLVTVGVGCGWALVTPDGALPRAVLVFAGLVAVGSALASGLRRLGSTFADRQLPAGMTFLAGVATLLAYNAIMPAYDSAGLILEAATIFAFLGTVLVLLPWGARSVAISLLAVLHFGGIATAILSTPPPEGPAPWVTQLALVKLYRPWLQFTHLTNAYHFYAPEPGPVALVYFRLEYADGTSRWVRLPDHQNCRTGLETRRMGALATSLAQPAFVPGDRLANLAEARRQAGEKHNPELPMNPEMPWGMQYREPGVQAKMQIASYVRHLAQTEKHPTDPGAKLTGIKVYKVDYRNASAEHFRDNQDPLDPTLYSWFYMGDHEPNGELKPSSLQVTYNAEGQEASRVQDPFLYWMLPVFRAIPRGEKDMKVIHCARIQAGDKETERNP